MAIQKIQGEQPFQVLATNFSISPSNEGYTLQISANGKDYSNLFTVGANVTRLVTGVANGSYYRLSGNNSEVSINWRTQCNDGGSGGGSGSGSTVSVNQVLSAGTEIAQITVDGNTTSLYAPEGGGQGGDMNMLVPVPEFPENAEDDGTVVSKYAATVLEWQEMYDEDTEKSYAKTTISNLEELPVNNGTEAGMNFVIAVFPDNSLLTLRYNPEDEGTASLKYWTAYGDIAQDSYIWEMDRESGGEETIEVGEYTYVVDYTGGDGSEYDRDITIKGYTDYGGQDEEMFDLTVPGEIEHFIDIKGDKNTLFMRWGTDGDENPIWEPIIPDTSNLVPWYALATINGSAITNGGNIEIQGGSGSGDYMVVSELPASAETGQLFYVPEHIQVTNYSGGVALDASSVSEDYVGWIKKASDNSTVGNIYKSGSNFFWGWELDGNIHSWEDNGNSGFYRCDGANGIFYFWPTSEGLYVEPKTEAGCSTAATTDYSYSETIPAATYRYLNGQFVLVPDVEQVRVFTASTNSSNAEWAAIFTAFSGLSEEGRYNATLILKDMTPPYAEDYRVANICAKLTNITSNGNMWFYGYSQTYNGEQIVPYGYSFELRSDGRTLNIKEFPLSIGIKFKIDTTGHTLAIANSSGNYYNWYQLLYTFTTSTPVAATASYDGYAVPVIVKPGNVEADFTLSGTHYRGVWTFDSNGSTLVSWDEILDYQVVSTLTDVTATEGLLVYTKDTHKLQVYNGTSWDVLN